MIQAARGALGHWVKIQGGKISHYQIITPTTWHASPRDSEGVRGGWEEALIGTKVVDPENHPRFYRVIRSFCEATGVGGVLNTSFNLHGEPVVCSPEDAIHTLIESDLDAIQIESYLIERERD